MLRFESKLFCHIKQTLGPLPNACFCMKWFEMPRNENAFPNYLFSFGSVSHQIRFIVFTALEINIAFSIKIQNSSNEWKTFSSLSMTETFEATFFMSSFFFFNKFINNIYIYNPPQKKKNLYRTFEINQLELQLTRAHLESFQRGRIHGVKTEHRHIPWISNYEERIIENQDQDQDPSILQLMGPIL